MVGINICAKLSMICTNFNQIYLYKNSFRGHQCPISHIDALSIPFSMEMKKASILMPGYDPRCPVAPLGTRSQPDQSCSGKSGKPLSLVNPAQASQVIRQTKEIREKSIV